MKNKGEKYCGYCGAEMITIRIGAEEVMECYGDFCRKNNYPRYIRETGKRNWAWNFKCPNTTKRFNKHDNYYIKT